MEGTARPDYKACVAISTNASLSEMIPPGALVMLTPVIVGTLFGVQVCACTPPPALILCHPPVGILRVAMCSVPNTQGAVAELALPYLSHPPLRMRAPRVPVDIGSVCALTRCLACLRTLPCRRLLQACLLAPW